MEIADKNEEIKNLKNATEQREIILKQSLEQLNKALSDSGKLQSQKDSIESELNRTKTTIEQLSNSKGETLQELENRNQQLDELQSQLDKLTAELKNKNTTNDQLSAELGKLRQLNEQINQEKEQLSKAVENGVSRRSQNADKISSLEQQIAELTQKLNTTGKNNINERKELESQIINLTKQLSDAQTNLESSEGNVQALGQELDNLRKQLETRKQQDELNKETVIQYEARITELRKQLEETQGENLEEVNEIKAKMETLKAQLKQKSSDLESAKENLEILLENFRQVAKATQFQPYQVKQQNDGTELTGGQLFEEVKQLANNANGKLKLHDGANNEELTQTDVPIIDAEDEAEESDIRKILNILNGISTDQAGGTSSAQGNIQVNLKNVAKLMINLFQYMNIKTNLVYDDSIIRKIFNILSDTQNEDVKTQYTKMLSSLFTTKLSFDPETGMLKKYEDVSSDIKSLNSEINQYLNGKDFLNKLISDKIDKTTSDNYNVILHNINIILIYLGNLNRKLINLKKIIETQNKDTTFIKSLDALSDSRVITYTKIRDSENSSNPRYLYAIDTDKYTSNNSSTIFTNASLDVLHANGYSQSGEGEGVEYDQYYNYGPFTKVLYNTSNKDFGRDHMGNIMDKLQNGEDVFVIGYGASGAGKTTTLIYDKSDPGNPNKPGAIVEMLNSHKFEGIDVTIYELYNGNKTTKKENVTFTIESNSDGNFEYKSGGISGGISLAKFLQEEIDNPENRQTKATSNNPQSSRSHIIVDIHIEKRVHLFVGDFAGVENVFDYSLTQDELETFYSNVLNNLNAINLSNIDNIDINNINELLREYDFPNKTLIEFSEQKNTDDEYAYKEPISDYNNKQLNEMNKEISDYYKNNYRVIPENFANIISNLIQNKYPAADKYSDLRITFKFLNSEKITTGNKRNTVKLKIGGTIYRNNYKEELKPIVINLFHYIPGVKIDNLLRITNYADSRINEMIYKAITGEIEISKTKFENNYEQGVIEILSKTHNYLSTPTQLKDSIKNYISEAESLINSTNANTSTQQQNNVKAIEISDVLSKRIEYLHKEAIVRSYEGLFINKTLENMRKTMTEIIKQTTYPSGLPLTPNFESSCIKQHCDPIMGTCFDVPIETVDINSLLKKDDIHDVIGNALEGNLLRINYCLCLVVNNTPDTNPPKIPYIDLTDMKKEYDRITRFNKGEETNGLILFRQNVDDVRGEGNPQIDLFVDAIQKKIEHHTGYKYKDWISKDIVNDKFGSTLDSIITLYNQSPYISIGQMDTIATMINIIKTNKNVAVFKKLIDIIDKNNNLVILGTLEFADQISKYNLKYEGCGVDISIHNDHNQSQLYFNEKKKYFRSSNNVRRLYKNKLEFEYTPTQPQAQVQQHRPSSKPPTNYERPNLTGEPYDIKDNEKNIGTIKQIMDKNGYEGLHIIRDSNQKIYTLVVDQFMTNDKIPISDVQLQEAINKSTTVQIVKEGKLQGGGTNSKKYTKKILPKLKLKKNRITIKKSC